MSQQKVLFAVCVVAALVALVSSQGMNPTTCAQKAQTQMTEYMKTVQQTFRDFSSSMASSGGQNVNMQGINNDLNDLAESYMQLTNMDNGLNAQDVMRATNGMLQKQLSLAMKYFMNPQMGLSGMTEGLKLQQNLLSANMDFVRKMIDSCFPRN